MATDRPRVPWLIVAFFAVFSVFALACYCEAGDWWDVAVDVSTDDLFVVDGGESPSGAYAPTLVLGVDPPSGDAESFDVRLDYVPDKGFVLSDVLTASWREREMEEDFQDTIDPRAVLTFDLEWVGGSDTGSEDFPTVEVQGAPSQVELWNEWTLDLEWYFQEGYCI